MASLSAGNCSDLIPIPDQAIAGHLLGSTGPPKSSAPCQSKTTDGQASAPSQICYQRLQNQFDRHFVGGIGAPLVSAEDVLDLAALLDRADPRWPSSDSVQRLASPRRARPFACKQRVTTKVARTAYLSGRVAAALMEKVPGGVCMAVPAPTEFRGKLN